jgi:branched-chain amino acid transport system substrate-binding protein
MPLSGPLSGYGATINLALQLGIEDINKAGGINGRKIEVVTEDNQSDPKAAGAAIRKLISVDKVQVVIGPFTAIAAAQIPIADELKTPVLFTTGDESLSQKSQWAFNFLPSAAKHASTIAEYAYTKLGYRKFAVALGNADQSVIAEKAFEETVKRLGGEIVLVEQYDINTTNFRSTVAKLQAANADVVFLNSAGGKDAGLLLKQMAEGGYRPKTISIGAPIEAVDTLAIAGETAEGVVYSGNQLDSSNPSTASFVERFKGRMEGRAPDFASALYYDMPSMLAQAGKAKGLNAEGLRAGLADVKEFSGVTGKLSSMPEDRNARWQNGILTIRKGAYVPYEQ